jgi:hypothetical protein
MIYTHVMGKGAKAVRSPLDREAGLSCAQAVARAGPSAQK